MDSLDSTLDKDNKLRSRSNEDMRQVIESTGEQSRSQLSRNGQRQSSRDTRHYDDDENDEDYEDANIDDHDKGQGDVDGSTFNTPNHTSAVTLQNADDEAESDNRVTDTTTKGGAGKTVSG